MSERMHLHIPPSDVPARDAATPRPWKLDVEDLRGGRYHVVRRGDDLDAIDLHEDENGEADARLIVRAVNAHDALVAALRLAIPMMEEAQEALCGDDTVCFADGDDGLMIALDAARAALALAKGAAP